MGPPLETGLADLGLSNAAIHAFAAELQVVVAAGVGVTLPSPSPTAPTGKVATLSLHHLHFVCRLAVNGYLTPICEEVARGKGSIEGLAALNQALCGS